MAEQSLKEKTAKGLFWGGLSNGVQQLLNLFFGIFLARILTPADYGMVGMLAIFTAIAGTLQESGFTSALTNKKEATHADYNAVFWFSLFTGSIIYVILFFCAPLIAYFFNIPSITPLARFLFLGFLISSTGTAHNSILFKKMMVKEKAKAIISALIISGTAGIIMAYNGMAYWGIAVQSVLYIFIVNILIWHFSPWRPTMDINFKPLKEMLPFSTKLLFTNIFVQINSNIFSVLLGKFYSKQEVGYYTQANKWTSMSYMFISSMLGNVAQPVLAEVSLEAERQRKIFRKMLRFTAFVSFPAMFGLALVAEEFIIISVTDKWLPCVSILQILCFWGAVVPINNLYSNVIISWGKSNIYMWNTISLGLTQLLVVFYTFHLGINAMIIAFVAINISWVFILHYFTWKRIGLRLTDVLKDVLPYAIIAGIIMMVTYLITHSITNVYLSFILKIGIAVCLYISTMWISNSIIFKECINYLLKKK